MSEQIREQVSAFLDGELPSSEAELLLKRLTRDPELRESFGRYALIGESLRGGGTCRLAHGFAARVNRAIDGGVAAVANSQDAPPQTPKWWRPLAGVTVAAGVAAVAFISFQQRADLTPNFAQTGATVHNAALGGQSPAPRPIEALSYTVPETVANAPSRLPAARLTNYVFAHSKYSSVMGQNDVLNDLLSNADAEDSAVHDGPRDVRTAP